MLQARKFDILTSPSSRNAIKCSKCLVFELSLTPVQLTADNDTWQP